VTLPDRIPRRSSSVATRLPYLDAPVDPLRYEEAADGPVSTRSHPRPLGEGRSTCSSTTRAATRPSTRKPRLRRQRARPLEERRWTLESTAQSHFEPSRSGSLVPWCDHCRKAATPPARLCRLADRATTHRATSRSLRSHCNRSSQLGAVYDSRSALPTEDRYSQAGSRIVL